MRTASLKPKDFLKRVGTAYPGVFYREAKRIGGKGTERVYYIIFKKDGKHHEEKVGRQYADNMTVAKASRIRGDRIEGRRLSRKQIRQQREAEANRWTLNRLWTDYKGSKQIKGLYNDNKTFEKHLSPNFGDKTPAEIFPIQIQSFKNELSKDFRPGTVKNILELLARTINHGVNMQFCQGISFKIKPPKVNNIQTEDLTPGQLERLLEAMDKDPNIQAANLMKMALYTGMRRGELFRLQWRDIDYYRNFLSICDPKGGIDQKIPLNAIARELLKSHPKTDSPYVFPGRNGNKRTTIKGQVNKIKKAANLPADFRPLHGLRHTYASMLASSGEVDLLTLQKLLTHKSPQMTQRYAHLRDESLRRASDVASDILKDAIKINKGR